VQANFWIRDDTSAGRHVLYDVQYATRTGQEHCFVHIVLNATIVTYSNSAALCTG